MPVPPPTLPSSGWSPVAALSAATTCSSFTVMAVDVVQVPVPCLRGDREQPDVGEVGVSLVHPGDDARVRETPTAWVL